MSANDVDLALQGASAAAIAALQRTTGSRGPDLPIATAEAGAAPNPRSQRE